MNWKTTLCAVAVIIGAFACSLQGASTLSADDARKKLAAGAVLVDVRTTGEFKTEHLAGAVNIPLDAIKSGITNVAADKSQVVLLHCRSGRRSGLAEKELRSLGYTNVFNIGSFGQAQKIVGEVAR